MPTIVEPLPGTCGEERESESAGFSRFLVFGCLPFSRGAAIPSGSKAVVDIGPVVHPARSWARQLRHPVTQQNQNAV